MTGLLPPRPLMIDPKAVAKERRKVFLLLALFLVAGVGFGAGGAYFTSNVLHHRHVWENGRPGQITDLSGEVRRSGKLGLTIFHDYDLQISFLDEKGQTHSGELEFSLFWSEADTSADPELRYLAASPEVFTLSPAVTSGPVSIWGATTMMMTLAALMLFAMFGTVRQSREQARRLRLVLEDGEEVLAELITVTNVQGNFVVRYQVDGESKPRSDSFRAPPLLVTDAKGSKVVLLRSPREPEHYVLVRHDLAPIMLDAAIREDIQRRAAGAPEG